ncbi:MAG: hypothetical protein IPN99_09840 [Bacteroidetes bacterium]|nr:hypothetical protein [Bacteroidota bacterium]
MARNREAISKLRNNVGFHGGTKLRSHEVGYSSFGLIHPQTPDLIMTCFALFFIEIDKVVVPEGNFKKHVDTEPVKKFMRERSEKLKKAIKDPSRQEAFNLLIEELKDMYGE